MASPTPSLESRANSLGSPVSLSPVTVSGSSPPASDSAICDVDSCDLCLDAPKSGEDPCPRCRLGSTGGTSRIRCTGCKSTEAGAVARCYDCDQFLCPNCVMAHQYMLCFEGHRLLNLADSKLETVGSGGGGGGGRWWQDSGYQRHRKQQQRWQRREAVATNAAPGDSVLDLTSKLMSATAIFPPKSQIKRQKMIYHCKFGEFGVMEGQFTEPSGVAVNAQNDIIVADTNNHRIQIFDKEGRFKFQFGECGKRDGQLLYPNRVAVVKTSGDIIVTERSPTHQIQIYNQYGQFVRKFGANILQHPRGVTVDSKGRIVVVECKVMRVIIFDQTGNVLQKFGCSKHLEFPNGVVVNDKQEIFISDNRAHCVKVFNYEGSYLRQIGGEGITNYPIGVGINTHGEILIADNHNNFNLTIFTQDGQLVSALESKVKHAQCFDVALMDDGSVVLASKDYRLYIYRYVQVPPIGM
ncbi:Brain tumor protein [Acromyrmex echinatior]|uniref:Brain tumor protein n=1 Tax=Acromyrmex echinatior TaxID=103372 RepID=F4X3V4_ACREC|nr:Brain tumor protein [Acromyrmex echinatior]